LLKRELQNPGAMENVENYTVLIRQLPSACAVHIISGNATFANKSKVRRQSHSSRGVKARQAEGAHADVDVVRNYVRKGSSVRGAQSSRCRQPG
jgi:hypothetical protein